MRRVVVVLAVGEARRGRKCINNHNQAMYVVVFRNAMDGLHLFFPQLGCR